jgi:hypothetical protein
VEWTDAQFDQMSWHDNHVHGLRVIEGEYGAGELVLDVDYILEWLEASAGFQFKIVPVYLRFKEVTDLRLALDYAKVSAGMSPFSIHRISRRTEARERYTAQCWEIELNWPDGRISFEATAFEQKAWGQVRISSGQVLRPEERVGAG